MSEIRDAINTAVEWAGNPQSKDAIIFHLGVHTSVDGVSIRFSPWRGGGGLLSFSPHPKVYNDDGFVIRMTDEQVRQVREALPAEPVKEWEHIHGGFSFVVPIEWHPAAVATMRDNYSACPKGLKPNTDKECKGVFCDCPERKAGYKRAVMPEGWH